METFLSLAQRVISEAKKPIHYKEITERALKLGLQSEGSTPWATMNARISMDIQKNGDSSIFYRSEPGFYGLRAEGTQKSVSAKAQIVKHRVTSDLNTKQKGDIAEARVAELITLYGDTGLSCYRPISDDEGIDIIVKKRGVLEVAYIQVKSTFGDRNNGFVSTVKEKNIINKRRMLMVFVYFDLTQGDIHEHVFCIPAPEFLKLTANENKQPGLRTFTVGLNRPDQSKYAKFLIEKRELANKVLEILNET
ncbi:MAG: hypothetical protein GW946_01595 [Candidatus Pacebacteria bacterium]|nr:hypothetical protein [Candidatus Paceibacterota bacterium]PIR60595.1 MAG: hypothetical protein COU67_01415 [Candidatus Pacebacteria bacterium CG10_big_fil_rev_8_21_14_0_10_44_54]